MASAFSHLELWNEPNNRYKWNFEQFDPSWQKFAEMIGAAAYWAKQRGCKTVLGGMMPVDHHWLNLMRRHGVLQSHRHHRHPRLPRHVVARSSQLGLARPLARVGAKIDYVAAHSDGKPVWVTETGLATWDLAAGRVAKFDLQDSKLTDAARAASEARIYWYSLIDLDPRRDAIEGSHVDENEYHMGLVSFEGTKKPAFDHLKRLLAR